jgi:flagellar biosynthesis chaperone FliJ
MQVNGNTQVSVDVLKKAIDTNKNQVNNLLNMQQNAQNKLQTQVQKNDTVPKSNTIGSLFDKKV